MPPARVRAAHEDLKSEVAAGKERNGHAAGTGKSRKNGNNALLVAVATKEAAANGIGIGATNGAGGQAGPGGMDWATEEPSLLHNYRALYALETPSAFQTPLNAALLTMPGIGRQSPTMAARKKAKRSTPKDQLALTVRKHFNSLAITETDVVVNFLYTVKTQDRSFKVKFGPTKK